MLYINGYLLRKLLPTFSQKLRESVSIILKKLCVFLVLMTFIAENNYIFITHATYINTLWIKWNFVIENDTTKVFTGSVTLNMDITGATQMRFGNTPGERDSASWESYSATKSWTLTSGDGKKTVYAEFQNASSNTIALVDHIVFTAEPILPYTTGLTLWLDAGDAATITESSGNISQWNDKSGNNYHARQNTGANQANIVDYEVDFNGSSDYFYLESLNYQNTTPMDGFLVCTVFRTNNTNTSLSGNWAFLDFDRSEWFNFYNIWDDIWISYDAGGIQDIATTWAGINDNTPHIACGSYDNTLTNDTVITIDGSVEVSEDREANGSQIGVGQATRYGFVGDGSEAATENAGRNNTYYDGGIYEIIYFDNAVSTADRQDIECYLWEKWEISVAGCPAETIEPIASVSYFPENTTSSNVIATLENESEWITITNNGGSSTYSFTGNTTFTFEFEDAFWNTGATLTQVDWIDPDAPSTIGTGSLNEAPTITSYSGASSASVMVLSGATDVATISAVDTAFNVIWEYGNTNLSGNTWLQVNTYEMCSPAVVVSHRQDVNGEIQRAPRVRNKTGTGFEVKVDNYNSTIGAISTEIDYIVMNAGSHSLPGGLHIETWSQNTSVVACNASNSPTPTAVNFLSSFSSAPSVLHTVSTENDATWTVSGVNGNTGNRGTEPTTTGMGVVLQRSFNSCTHAAEDVDYFAIEPGNYTLPEWTIIDATRSTDSIASITTTWNAINFTTAFASTPQTVLVSQLWEDGWNGWYAQIHTWWSEVTTTQAFATIDEDGPGADRNHTNEVAGLIAFNKSSGQFWEENTLTYSIIGGADSSDFTINSSNGDLDFITAKDPNNYTDTNSDGIYEVQIQVCDSHCNSGCSTQTILADVTDNISPIITGFSPGSGSLLPGRNHTISIAYNDAGVGIETGSDESVNFYRNIANGATITATANTTWWGVSGTGWIANGVISSVWSLDYEYHSDTTNAFIEFDYTGSEKIWAMTIYNRTSCCDNRLSNATIELFDISDTLVYTHTLWDTTWQSEITINFEDLWEIHDVSRIRLESTGADSYINIREIEIYPYEKNLVLQKWDGINWWNNIADNNINFTGSTKTQTGASYPLTDLDFWKYQLTYRVFDQNGNSTSSGSILYIDEPELIVSTGSIDIGTLSNSESFSDTVTITVHTVWAAFDVYMNTSTLLTYDSETITNWDGSSWYGYDSAPYSNTISNIWVNQSIAAQSGSININGNKNTYSYDIKLWALIEDSQFWWDYEWNIDFGINLTY